MGIKTFIRNYKLNKLRSSVSKASNYEGFDKVKKIGICFERNKNSKSVLAYADKLRQLGKEISLLEYIPMKNKEMEKEAVETPQAWFGKSHIGFSGEPTNADVSSFLSNDYGIYIDLTPSELHPVDYISLKVKAALKVGNAKRADLAYDLMLSIDENDNFDSVFKELDYYLNFINQNIG